MKPRNERILVIALLLLVSIGISSVSFAQDDTTATPAPSKTPDPTATETIIATPEATAEVEETPETSESRSYTQEDLSVLVGNVQRPNGIAWFNDNLYTICSGDWTIYEVHSETGATVTFVFGIQNAHDMVIEELDNGFNLWIPDFDTNTLKRVDHLRTPPESITTENLNGPWGIASVTEDAFLISNIRSNDLVHITRAGESRVIAEGFRSPTGLVQQDGIVYVANNGSARRAIEWFPLESLPMEDAEAEPVTDIAQPLVSGLQNVSSMVIGPDGYLYFVYALGTRGVVGRIEPQQCLEEGCTNEDVEIVVFTELQAPLAGLTISPDMRLFVHTIYRPEIYWVQLEN